MEQRKSATTPAEPDISRRNMLKVMGAGAASLAVMSAVRSPALAQGDAPTPAEMAEYTLDWDKTFPKSNRVDHQKVSYYNRLGINLVADLYIPRNIDRSRQHPALVVGHPFGGVKEQSSGLYAQTMAERGFIAVAHDASYNGESGGDPRFIVSPEAFVEDFSAGVDFLGVHPLVDRERIGAIGICGSGGFVLSAAQIDPRIKAVATASMYNMGRDRRRSLGDTMTEQDRREAIREVVAQRWAEADGGQKAYVIGTPQTITADSPDVAKEFYDYYRTPRGHHPRSTTAISLTSNGALMQFYPFQNMAWISPRPILMIAGEVANSRYFTEDAFSKASEPKELHIVPGAGHVDLYDRINLIPWDKLQSFFDEHLSV